MVFKLAASSLHHAIKTLPQALPDHYKKGIYALPGLSFNPNAVKLRKTAQFQLSHFFREKVDNLDELNLPIERVF